MIPIHGTNEPMDLDRRSRLIQHVLPMVDSLGTLIGICDAQDQPALRDEILKRVKSQAAWSEAEKRRNT